MGNNQNSCGCQPEPRNSYSLAFREEKFERVSNIPKKEVTFGPSEDEEKVYQIGRRKILDVKFSLFDFIKRVVVISFLT